MTANLAVEIRRAVPSDAAMIRDVQTKTWLDTYPNEEYGITSEAIVEQTSRWHESGAVELFANRLANEADDTASLRLVAIVGKKVVGHC
jgi:hypothetical protein